MGGVPFWVSGGVPIEDIGEYLRLGVRAVGLTASLFRRRRWYTEIRAHPEQRSAAAEAAAAAIGD